MQEQCTSCALRMEVKLSIAGKGKQEIHCQKDKDDEDIIEEPDETGVR